jgi:hypothetical protein
MSYPEFSNSNDAKYKIHGQAREDEGIKLI